MEIVVRRAVPDDGSRIADIYNQGIQARMATFETDLRTADEQRQWIEEHSGAPAVVAVVNGVVVGFAHAAAYRSRPCYRGIGEFSMYVDANSRSCGVGKTLLNALVAEAQELGYWKLVSRIFDCNTASRKLCQACGFREVGIYEKHGKLDGRWIDCVIVERVITENLR
ncbi:arsinothricin resistance N-acetyltransferase ArsN1 family A [Sulfobacillus harzensis]|uniref:N-acetyltransferase n=1 Tax=Sulfobacillus harzensis TaxID=2729629 RepID=A0A7Y0L7J6_9FIRM|nr:arsinothricin resistance N-acetyltransferase ArsN1 family A [Sulfobacillus harzensis]NMP24670.1 N-acetyltransferase [Sulfobacillus harzensis]